MKKITIILITTMLTGCAPQVIHLTDEQVSMLSNAQLYDFKNNYLPNGDIEAEVGRRNLICDPLINESLGRGNRLGTPAMALCVKELQENIEMKAKLERNEQQMQQQQIQLQNQQTQKMLLEHIENQRYMDNF